MSTGILHIAAERCEQIEQHGYEPAGDLNYDGAELALAAKSYLDTAIDMALRPDLRRAAHDVPESWPWPDQLWKEPAPDQRLKALAKAGALIAAEIDRELAVQAIIAAITAPDTKETGHG